MDRRGLVVETLNNLLPERGRVLDIGAGDGYTARRVVTEERSVVALEPAAEMIRMTAGGRLAWVRGDAASLPFRDGTFGAAYATWAYFFSRNWDPTPGLKEAHRVVRQGGRIVVADNLGGDEFTAMAPGDITADRTKWKAWGFDCIELATSFEFESVEEARLLLGFYFGEPGIEAAGTEFSFRVGVFVGESAGPHATANQVDQAP